MIEMLIVAAIVAKLGLDSAGKFAVDVGFGVRGKASPRLAEARARRPRGAASNYFSELWDDAWTDASKKRAARRVRSSSPSRPRGAARIYLSNLWRDGWDGLERRRQEKATRPRPGQQTVPGTVVPNAQDEDRPHTAPVPDEDETVPQDEHPYLTEDRDEDEQDEPTPGPESVPDSGPDTLIPPDWLQGPAPTTTTEGPTMTTIPTGEVTSLSQTIRFCEDSAQAYRAQVHAIEQTQATLSAEEVSGPAADAFAAAMEQSHSAAASMEAAATEFKKHLIVQEAYDAVQGAGTKRFITAAR